MSTITKKTFVNELNKNHGVVDTNNMSDGLKKALSNRGITDAELKKVAGADGQIKGKDEFKKLFKAVDQFDKRTPNSFQADHLTNKGTCREQYSKTLSGEVYDKLKKEVANNRLEARYQQPGVRPAEEQAKLTIKNNALTVPESDRKRNVELKMKGVNQFTLHPNDDKKAENACFEAAKKQATDFNHARLGNHAPKLNGSSDAIQVAYQEDFHGRVKADPGQAKIAREYIDKCLDKKLPVVVGASTEDNNINNDKLTDHFVTIYGRGYDKDGKLFYKFKDPGNRGKEGKLYVDQDTGKLFKQGTHGDDWRKVRQADYQITQVRTYKGIN
ncbi:MAG TPA: hypothetical protein VH815_05000 [Acidobacteriota bacterium]